MTIFLLPILWSVSLIRWEVKSHQTPGLLICNNIPVFNHLKANPLSTKMKISLLAFNSLKKSLKYWLVNLQVKCYRLSPHAGHLENVVKI